MFFNILSPMKEKVYNPFNFKTSHFSTVWIPSLEDRNIFIGEKRSILSKPPKSWIMAKLLVWRAWNIFFCWFIRQSLSIYISSALKRISWVSFRLFLAEFSFSCWFCYILFVKNLSSFLSFLLPSLQLSYSYCSSTPCLAFNNVNSSAMMSYVDSTKELKHRYWSLS